MKKEYDMILDDGKVTLSISRKKVSLNKERLDVRTASIGKKRRNSTFRIILYIIAVIAAGVPLYAALNTFLGGDVEGEPFQELDTFSRTEYRIDMTMEPSSLFLTASGDPPRDLSGSVTWMSGSLDTIEIDEASPEPTTLHIMWYGSASDLMTREISHLRITVDSGDNHILQNVEIVVLDEDALITSRIPVTLPSSEKVETGRSIYDINVNDLEMGAARNLQSGLSSSYKATLIKVRFPDGISTGEIEVNAEWGPEYYHETTQRGLFIGGASAIITLGALFFVYTRVAKDEACLILDTDDAEYVLFGDHKDISSAYLEISKITIPRMRGADERKKERPGLTRGEDLLDRDEAIQIGKELKKRPGGSGKMIVHQCPECLGTELYYESGFMTGYKYHCKNCDYVGSFVIEKQVNFDQ